MKKVAGFLFCFFSMAGLLEAQVPAFQNYALLRRNEPIQVYTLFQDQAGFIWYGTNKGLFRFDGVNLDRYTVADSLPEDHVTALGQDSLGRIWTGHKNGKLAFMEGDKIRTFNPDEGTSSNEISDILFDRKGNLWFSTLDDGLYYFTQGRLFRLDEQEGLPDIFVYDILEDPAGNIWAGTDGGVAICKLNDKKVDIRVLDYEHGLPDNIVKKLVIDENHTVWMATEDAGIVSFDPKIGRTKSLVDGGWKYGAVTDFVLSGDQAWIATVQSGLIICDLNSRRNKLYGNNVGFDLMSINALLNDHEGNIWIGSKSGVIRSLGDYVESIQRFDPYKDANVLAVTVDANDQLWYSTREGLFKRSSDERSNFKIEKLPVSSSTVYNTVISLFTDSLGYVWAGTYGDGVLRINPSTRKIQHLRKELRNGNVLSIAGSGNEIWLATLGGASRVRISSDKLEVENYGRDEGLISEYIYQVFLDSRKRVWFATDGRGVGMMDDSGFHHFEKGLTAKVIYGFAEDDKKQIWVNVQAEGLFRLDNDTFHPITANSPLRDKNINCLTSDGFGNLIAMHDLGIDIFSPASNRIRYLGEEVGVGNKRPNLNALGKDQRGRIYFGTENGIVSFADPTGGLLTSPKPQISGLRVLDQKMAVQSGLKFSYDENSVHINYLGFWYQNPGNLNYQYKLENYDRDWISSRDRSATYSRLQPGSYTFKVRVSDTEDFTNASEASLSFSINPPFWRMTWFYVFCGSLLIIAGSSFIHYREKKLLEDKRILEEKVTERTLEIQQQAEEIQAQNEEIQSQAEEIQGINDNLEELVKARTAELIKKNKAAEESAFIIAHELRAPVASLLGLINLISKCELNDEAKTVVTHMEDSAEKLEVVVRNITKAIERGDK
jgi:ligand-binding sensor domain-containing protein